MPKINYLRALIDDLEEDQMRSILEEYAKQDKSFEAFVIEKSGRAVETGKTYQEYRDEMLKVLEKCSTRKGFVKVTRLKNAGLASFEKLLASHFNNENFVTALWMSLSLMEMLHGAILQNTRYRWANKPYKSFEKILDETRDRFDTAFQFAKPNRKQHQQIVKAIVRMWWAERERPYEHRYFDEEDLFRYAKRDEDLLSIQICLQELQPRAQELDKKYAKRSGSWKNFWSQYFDFGASDEETHPETLMALLNQVEAKVKVELEKWD